MPTQRPVGLFLALCNPANWQNSTSKDCESDSDSDDEVVGQDSQSAPTEVVYPPFAWPDFQARTGICGNIFSPKPTQWTPDEWQDADSCERVWSFVMKFWNMTSTEQVEFIKQRRLDNDSDGRTLICKWYKKFQTKATFEPIIWLVLNEYGLDPLSQMRTLKLDKVSMLQISLLRVLYQSLPAT